MKKLLLLILLFSFGLASSAQILKTKAFDRWSGELSVKVESSDASIIVRTIIVSSDTITWFDGSKYKVEQDSGNKRKYVIFLTKDGSRYYIDFEKRGNLAMIHLARTSQPIDDNNIYDIEYCEADFKLLMKTKKKL